MESRIEDLLAKYWEGESSLKEESRIRDHFRNNPSLTPEGRYFATLNEKRQGTNSFKHPGKFQTRTWLSIAASLVLGLSVAFLVIQDARKQREFVIEDPQEAYEITRKALLMVSTSLNEGTAYTGELKNLNEAEKIVKELEK